MPRNAETPTEVAKKRCQRRSVFKTADAIRKYAPKWMSVMKPSIRSKLLQKALNGFTAKRSARNTTKRNAPTPHRRRDFFGRNSGCRRARRRKQAKMSSMTILKVKALPVINGKKSGDATMSGTKGIRKTPPRVTQRRVRSTVVIDDYSIIELFDGKLKNWK